MARNDPQVNFRIPAELKAKLVETSAANGRTLNAEIVHRLEESFVLVESNFNLEDKLSLVLSEMHLLKQLIGVEQSLKKASKPQER